MKQTACFLTLLVCCHVEMPRYPCSGGAAAGRSAAVYGAPHCGFGVRGGDAMRGLGYVSGWKS